MVDQNEAYTFQKRGIFYFSKRVPSDLRELYKVSRLTYSLKTKCPKLAKTKVRDAIHKLERYWNKVRIDKKLPCSHFLVSDIAQEVFNNPVSAIPQNIFTKRSENLLSKFLK